MSFVNIIGKEVQKSKVNKILDNILLFDSPHNIIKYNKLSEDQKKIVIENLRKKKSELLNSNPNFNITKEERQLKLNTINDFFKNVFEDDNTKTDQQFFLVKLKDLRQTDQYKAAETRTKSQSETTSEAQQNRKRPAESNTGSSSSSSSSSNAAKKQKPVEKTQNPPPAPVPATKKNKLGHHQLQQEHAAA